MIGAARVSGVEGVSGALLGGVLSQVFGFRVTIIGAAFFSISGFLFYNILKKDEGMKNV